MIRFFRALLNLWRNWRRRRAFRKIAWRAELTVGTFNSKVFEQPIKWDDGL